MKKCCAAVLIGLSLLEFFKVVTPKQDYDGNVKHHLQIKFKMEIQRCMGGAIVDSLSPDSTHKDKRQFFFRMHNMSYLFSVWDTKMGCHKRSPYLQAFSTTYFLRCTWVPADKGKNKKWARARAGQYLPPTYIYIYI